MKRTLKLIFILSMFVSVSHAQKIKTIDEYKILYDSIVSHLEPAKENMDTCIGKPFSDFVKYLSIYDMKITRVGWFEYDHQKLYPKHLYGMTIFFTTRQSSNFAFDHNLRQPFIVIHFNESKPYEEALNLSQKYKGYFVKEVENFYSDAVVKSIEFYDLDGMYAQPR